MPQKERQLDVMCLLIKAPKIRPSPINKQPKMNQASMSDA